VNSFGGRRAVVTGGGRGDFVVPAWFLRREHWVVGVAAAFLPSSFAIFPEETNRRRPRHRGPQRNDPPRSSVWRCPSARSAVDTHIESGGLRWFRS
jgi:hypothetical protein